LAAEKLARATHSFKGLKKSFTLEFFQEAQVDEFFWHSASRRRDPLCHFIDADALQVG